MKSDFVEIQLVVSNEIIAHLLTGKHCAAQWRCCCRFEPSNRFLQDISQESGAEVFVQNPASRPKLCKERCIYFRGSLQAVLKAEQKIMDVLCLEATWDDVVPFPPGECLMNFIVPFTGSDWKSFPVGKPTNETVHNCCQDVIDAFDELQKELNVNIVLSEKKSGTRRLVSIGGDFEPVVKATNTIMKKYGGNPCTPEVYEDKFSKRKGRSFKVPLEAVPFLKLRHQADLGVIEIQRMTGVRLEVPPISEQWTGALDLWLGHSAVSEQAKLMDHIMNEKLQEWRIYKGGTEASLISKQENRFTRMKFAVTKSTCTRLMSSKRLEEIMKTSGVQITTAEYPLPIIIPTGFDQALIITGPLHCILEAQVMVLEEIASSAGDDFSDTLIKTDLPPSYWLSWSLEEAAAGKDLHNVCSNKTCQKFCENEKVTTCKYCYKIVHQTCAVADQDSCRRDHRLQKLDDSLAPSPGENDKVLQNLIQLAKASGGKVYLDPLRREYDKRFTPPLNLCGLSLKEFLYRNFDKDLIVKPEGSTWYYVLAGDTRHVKFPCTFCALNFPSEMLLDVHLESVRHRQSFQRFLANGIMPGQGPKECFSQIEQPHLWGPFQAIEAGAASIASGQSSWTSNNALMSIIHEPAQHKKAPAPSATLGTHRLPIRPGAKDCKHFKITGKCAYGAKCTFNHPEKGEKRGIFLPQPPQDFSKMVPAPFPFPPHPQPHWPPQLGAPFIGTPSPGFIPMQDSSLIPPFLHQGQQPLPPGLPPFMTFPQGPRHIPFPPHQPQFNVSGQQLLELAEKIAQAASGQNLSSQHSIPDQHPLSFLQLTMMQAMVSGPSANLPNLQTDAISSLDFQKNNVQNDLPATLQMFSSNGITRENNSTAAPLFLTQEIQQPNNLRKMQHLSHSDSKLLGNLIELGKFYPQGKFYLDNLKEKYQKEYGEPLGPHTRSLKLFLEKTFPDDLIFTPEGSTYYFELGDHLKSKAENAGPESNSSGQSSWSSNNVLLDIIHNKEQHQKANKGPASNASGQSSWGSNSPLLNTTPETEQHKKATEEVTFLQGLKLGSHGLPLWPEHKDCFVYQKTGACSFGAKCQFNHPEPIQAMEEVPLLQGLKLGLHGLPLWPEYKDCLIYKKTGACSFGANCRFNHPEPMKVFAEDSKTSSQDLRMSQILSGNNEDFQAFNHFGSLENQEAQNSSKIRVLWESQKTKNQLNFKRKIEENEDEPASKSSRQSSTKAPNNIQPSSSVSVPTGITNSKQESFPVYVSLSAKVDDTVLRQVLSEFGTIRRLRVAESKETGQFKGFCMVEYTTLKAAKEAVQFSGSTAMGIFFHVEPRY